MSKQPGHGILVEWIPTGNRDGGNKEVTDPAICLPPSTVADAPYCRDDAGDGDDGTDACDVQFSEIRPVRDGSVYD